MSSSAFTNEKQTAFKAALAQAAGVASEAVVINKIESISSRRRLLEEAIRVDTSIMAQGEAAANAMADTLTADSINTQLSSAGLPTATVLKGAAVVSASPPPPPCNDVFSYLIWWKIIECHIVPTASSATSNHAPGWFFLRKFPFFVFFTLLWFE